MICKYAEIFCWKNVSSFCSTHIFSAKNIKILCIESTKTVNEMTLNELVKLTTLWTTGPCTLALDTKGCRDVFFLLLHVNMLWIVITGVRIVANNQSWNLKIQSKNYSYFFLSLNKNICCGYSLEVPQGGTSNEYPQHMFSWRNKISIMLLLPLIWSYKTSN